jgi:hypothetical protein
LDKLSYREAGSALTEDPKVWSRAEATGFAIGELDDQSSASQEQLETQSMEANKVKEQ